MWFWCFASQILTDVLNSLRDNFISTESTIPFADAIAKNSALSRIDLTGFYHTSSAMKRAFHFAFLRNFQIEEFSDGMRYECVSEKILESFQTRNEKVRSAEFCKVADLLEDKLIPFDVIPTIIGLAWGDFNATHPNFDGEDGNEGEDFRWETVQQAFATNLFRKRIET